MNTQLSSLSGIVFRGGGSVWSEVQTVKAERGIFQVLLGSVKPIPAEVFTASPNRYLEIDIDSPLNDPPMTPRQRLVTVAYAFLADEAVHSKEADRAKHADTATTAQTAITALTADTAETARIADISRDVVDNSITTPKITDEAITTGKIKDAAVSPQKLSDEVHQMFISVSTHPETQGHLVLPGSAPFISASVQDGKITLANDTMVTGKLEIGPQTITIGTSVDDPNADEIVFSNAPGFITGQGVPLTIRTTQGNHPMTLQTSGNANLNLNPGGRIVFGSHIDSDINFFGPRVINSNQLLGLNTTGDGPITTGTGLFTFGGDVQINGNDIQDSNGTPRITFDPANNNTTVTGRLSTGEFRLGTTATAGNVLTADVNGAGSWQPPVAGTDNDWTISGNNMYANVSGNVGIGTTNPIEKLDVTESDEANKDSTLLLRNLRIPSAERGYLASLGQIDFMGKDAHTQDILYARIKAIMTYGYNPNADLAFYTMYQPGATPNFAERMRITANGNVGIGTTNPAYKTEIYDSNASGVDLLSLANWTAPLCLDTLS
ncbi:MAG: hypothetical protein ABIJ11_05290 [Elusimicrobiota bacterium]